MGPQEPLFTVDWAALTASWASVVFARFRTARRDVTVLMSFKLGHDWSLRFLATTKLWLGAAWVGEQ